MRKALKQDLDQDDTLEGNPKKEPKPKGRPRKNLDPPAAIIEADLDKEDGEIQAEMEVEENEGGEKGRGRGRGRARGRGRGAQRKRKPNLENKQELTDEDLEKQQEAILQELKARRLMKERDQEKKGKAESKEKEKDTSKEKEKDKAESKEKEKDKSKENQKENAESKEKENDKAESKEKEMDKVVKTLKPKAKAKTAVEDKMEKKRKAYAKAAQEIEDLHKEVRRNMKMKFLEAYIFQIFASIYITVHVSLTVHDLNLAPCQALTPYQREKVKYQSLKRQEAKAKAKYDAAFARTLAYNASVHRSGKAGWAMEMDQSNKHAECCRVLLGEYKQMVQKRKLRKQIIYYMYKERSTEAEIVKLFYTLTWILRRTRESTQQLPLPQIPRLGPQHMGYSFAQPPKCCGLFQLPRLLLLIRPRSPLQENWGKSIFRRLEYSLTCLPVCELASSVLVSFFRCDRHVKWTCTSSRKTSLKAWRFPRSLRRHSWILSVW